MPYSTEDVAKAAHTTLRGVRLWDGHNMLGEVKRDEYGARVFTDAHLQRAREISAAQKAGMSLPEIKGASSALLYEKIDEAAEFLRDVQASIYREMDL